MSLRTRLLLGLVVLAAIGLLVADAATYGSLRPFLTGRVDQQLQAAAAPMSRTLHSTQFGGPGDGSGGFGEGPGPNQTFPPGTYGELRDPDGDAVRVSFNYGQANVPVPKLPAELPPAQGAGKPATFTVGAVTDASYRFRVLVDRSDPDGDVVLVAIPLADVSQTLGRLVLIEGVVTGGVLLGLLVLAWWIVRLGLRPLQRMEVAAEAIAGGELSRRVEPANDRTEVGRLGLALNAMLAQIEAAFDERTASEDRLRRFVGDASHELRTPLTSIRGYAELFRRGAGSRPEDLATSMRRIEEEASRMGVLVDDLLLLARLDQGRPLERKPVDLARIASDAAADARATDPGREIRFDAPPEVVVWGDEARLRQVTANLLSNAVNHTPPGSPVEMRLHRGDGAADDAVVLEIIDHGPGMTAEDASRIFERFYRAEASRMRHGDGGAGLGLSIADAIVRAHGGSISVLTRPGEGAKFVVTLPATPVAAPSPASAPAEVPVLPDIPPPPSPQSKPSIPIRPTP